MKNTLRKSSCLQLIILLFFIVVGCTKQPVLLKPALTIEQFNTEAKTLLGVIKKFVDDNDPAVVHEVSLGLESSLAVDCLPIGEECKQFHDIVTTIIQLTYDRKFTLEEKMQVLKMYYVLETTIQNTRSKLVEDWKKYN
jgi:hypothetical protein